jgi:cytochrome c nitrite reductase small subunit
MRTLLMAIIIVSVGLALGIGGYTFIYAKGNAYLTNNPEACANCHIMQEQFDSWVKSSHRAAAVCNDCHTPNNFFGKYLTKASNGFWHSFYFTTQRFHEPIQINARNLRVTEAACRDCHAGFLETPGGSNHLASSLQCTHCHSSVGHSLHR